MIEPTRITDTPHWYVYGLYDHHNTLFYVGRARNPAVRIAGHFTKSSPTLPYIREIEGEGGHVTIKVIATLPTASQAALREIYEIQTRPALINICGVEGRKRSVRMGQSLPPLEAPTEQACRHGARLRAIRERLGVKPSGRVDLAEGTKKAMGLGRKDEAA